MIRSTPLALAALLAAIIGLFGMGLSGMAPARAAGIPAGAAVMVDTHGKVETSEVRHRRVYRRHYRHRRYVYRRVYYRPAPVYYRRCVTRPRIVWTPYGYVRRWVRVCRY